MSAPSHHAPLHRLAWAPPLDVAVYDRRPALTSDEQAALEAFVLCDAGWAKAQLTLVALERLVRPLYDALACGGCVSWERHAAVRVVAGEMHRRQSAHWAWSDQDWAVTLRRAATPSPQRGSSHDVRSPVAVLAYLLGHLHDLSPLLTARSVQWVTLAGHVFGPDVLEAALAPVWAVLAGWGYRPLTRGKLRMALALALLDARSPHPFDLSTEGLVALRGRAHTRPLAAHLELLARALAHLGLIAAPLFPCHGVPVPFGERPAPPDVAPEWLDWCRRWHRAAVGLTLAVRDNYASILVRTGRWLAQVHPAVTAPEQWSYELAAEWSEMVRSLTVGHYAGQSEARRFQGRVGAPLRASTKATLYVALRTFFSDLQEEPFSLRRRFDPARAFRIPATVQQAIGPDPRALDIRWWAMLVHAAVHLDACDLPPALAAQYPLTLVRAVAIVWCYAALRSDEIRRLEVGCVRWQREDVSVAETGDVLSKDAVCFLSIPTNKTSAAFAKAVNPLVGRAIEAWKRERPTDQPPLPDRKTGQLTDHLFRYRGRLIGAAYITTTLIPILCRRAGLPTADERGAITSHRARSTIATALYNAPDGMTIWELMQWLGHKNPASTQQYVRATPTKVAVAYEKAERTSRLIEVLVDHKADTERDIKVYYVLGEQGLCANAAWSTCLYRMACLKCPFFLPRDQAALVRSRDTVETFLKKVHLTPDEIAAVEDDRAKLSATHERTRSLPMPQTLHQRAAPAAERGIPLRVIQGRID